jgi:hypothetical protein
MKFWVMSSLEETTTLVGQTLALVLGISSKLFLAAGVHEDHVREPNAVRTHFFESNSPLRKQSSE